MTSQNKHCHCTTHHKVRIKNASYPWLSTLLIVLLPKCPFCILAYTSAITVCSAKSLAGHSPVWTSYISVAFALFTFCIVAWNYKGKKTIVACLFILAGSLLIARSELYSGLLTSYYWGSALLIAGVWVNGSFSYFVKLFATRISKAEIAKQVAHHG
jgi:hypothetical protein